MDCAYFASGNECSELFTETRQIKVVVVGKANIGKTSIVKRIKKDWGFLNRVVSSAKGVGRRIPTDGIEIHRWSHPKTPNTTLHLRDFAGQVNFF